MRETIRQMKEKEQKTLIEVRMLKVEIEKLRNMHSKFNKDINKLPEKKRQDRAGAAPFASGGDALGMHRGLEECEDLIAKQKLQIRAYEQERKLLISRSNKLQEQVSNFNSAENRRGKQLAGENSKLGGGSDEEKLKKARL